MFESQMTTYYGTKRVSAWPEFRDNAEGYGVQYEDGYISWSPKAAFEAAYRSEGQLNFGHALEALKSGLRVQRAGWNDKGMWLALVNAENYTVDAVRSGSHSVLPFTGMKTADDHFVPWLVSQTDVLAEDWSIV